MLFLHILHVRSLHILSHVSFFWYFLHANLYFYLFLNLSFGRADRSTEGILTRRCTTEMWYLREQLPYTWSHAKELFDYVIIIYVQIYWMINWKYSSRTLPTEYFGGSTFRLSISMCTSRSIRFDRANTRRSFLPKQWSCNCFEVL